MALHPTTSRCLLLVWFIIVAFSTTSAKTQSHQHHDDDTQHRHLGGGGGVVEESSSTISLLQDESSSNNNNYTTCSRKSENEWLQTEKRNYISGNFPEDFRTGRKAASIVPKFFALASFVGSALIVWELVTSHRRSNTSSASFQTNNNNNSNNKNKLKMSFFRLLLVMSISDMISSFALFFTDWTVPKTTPELYIPYSDKDCSYQAFYDATFPYAAGNIATCTIQGFLIHVGLSLSVLFTGALSLNCYFTIRHNWREEKHIKFERVFVPCAFVLVLFGGIYNAFVKQFNPHFISACWISPNPLVIEFTTTKTTTGGYLDHLDVEPDYPENARGTEQFVFNRILGANIGVLLTLLTIIFSMVSILVFVKGRQQRLRKNVESADEWSAMVLWKGMLYTGGFLLIWLPVMVFQFFSNGSPILEVVVPSLLSSQGIINVLVYGDKISFLILFCQQITSSLKAALNRLVRHTCCWRVPNSKTRSLASPQGSCIEFGSNTGDLNEIELFTIEENIPLSPEEIFSCHSNEEVKKGNRTGKAEEECGDIEIGPNALMNSSRLPIPMASISDSSCSIESIGVGISSDELTNSSRLAREGTASTMENDQNNSCDHEIGEAEPKRDNGGAWPTSRYDINVPEAAEANVEETSAHTFHQTDIQLAEASEGEPEVRLAPSVQQRQVLGNTLSVEQDLENALDLVRASISSTESVESDGDDDSLVDPQQLRLLEAVSDALERTRDLFEGLGENGEDIRRNTSSNPRVIPGAYNFSTSAPPIGCQPPPPAFQLQPTLFPLSRSFFTPSSASGSPANVVDILDILDEALNVVASDIESIASTVGTTTVGTNSSGEGRSVLSGRSSELETLLEETLDAVNELAQRQEKHSRLQTTMPTAPTRARITDVPRVLERIRHTEVSMLSSAIEEDDQSQVQEEENSSDSQNDTLSHEGC